MSAPEGVVLLGKGGYGAEPAEELEGMAAAVRRSGHYTPVETCFIDLGSPALPAALDRCVEGGARRILIVAAFVPMDRSLRVWLPQILRRWLKRRRGPDVEIVLSDSLGESPTAGQAVLDVLDTAIRTDVRVNAPADHGNPGWSVIPATKQMAFFCGGPRCTTRGAGDLQRHLGSRLRASGLNRREDDEVYVVRTGCLYPCNLGPVMLVYPEGAWYCSLTEEVIDEIVAEHFVNGRVLARYTREPGRARQTRPVPALPTDPVEDDPYPVRDPPMSI